MQKNEDKNMFTRVQTDGYDALEVDKYIQELQAELAMEKEKNSQTSQKEIPDNFLHEFEAMQKELKSYREIETKLKEALRATHKATENIQQIVENESRRILFEANKNADEIIAEALEQSIIALRYIKKMRTDARVFQKRFEVFISAQHQFIDASIWNEILAPIDSYEFLDINTIDDIKKIDKNVEEKE